MQKFNLNSNILVQITEYGWKHLNKTVGEKYIKYSILPYKQMIDEEEWYRFQAHQAMELFGESVDSTIKINILIPETN